mmetsp:Transcript_3509/g.6992  ORF Transcript_3509/g.6992 Transcript_3509/m.6992 type:complete len:95 (-) Transcript_3509:1212-1496(-)
MGRFHTGDALDPSRKTSSFNLLGTLSPKRTSSESPCGHTLAEHSTATSKTRQLVFEEQEAGPLTPPPLGGLEGSGVSLSPPAPKSPTTALLRAR